MIGTFNLQSNIFLFQIVVLCWFSPTPANLTFLLSLRLLLSRHLPDLQHTQLPVCLSLYFGCSVTSSIGNLWPSGVTQADLGVLNFSSQQFRHDTLLLCSGKDCWKLANRKSHPAKWLTTSSYSPSSRSSFPLIVFFICMASDYWF